MTGEQFVSWLKRWVAGHQTTPLPMEREAYTREVMARIARAESPQASRETPAWWRRPQWALALGSAAAAAIVLTVGEGRPRAPLARVEPIVSVSLAEEPEAAGALGKMWQELEVLNQLNEDADEEVEPADDASGESTDELLEELEWMDTAGSAAS